MIVKIFQDKQIRISVNENGEVWFIAIDVAKILEYSDTNAMTKRLDADEKSTCTDNSSGQAREVTIISESGLYSAILSSNKKEAKVFKNWVTKEVLPSLRKHGTYSIEGISNSIQEENLSLQRRIDSLDSEINSLYIELCKSDSFLKYNTKLSAKKILQEKISANNKAIKINSMHTQNIMPRTKIDFVLDT
jgi:prophage antirepressor-like protein